MLVTRLSDESTPIIPRNDLVESDTKTHSIPTQHDFAKTPLRGCSTLEALQFVEDRGGEIDDVGDF
jgi:hypothetical protein